MNRIEADMEDGESAVKCEDRESLSSHLLRRGWEGDSHFEGAFGVKLDDLVGKWFSVVQPESDFYLTIDEEDLPLFENDKETLRVYDDKGVVVASYPALTD